MNRRSNTAAKAPTTVESGLRLVEERDHVVSLPVRDESTVANALADFLLEMLDADADAI